MKNIIIVIAVVFFGMTANAQDKVKDKNAKVSFRVDGNCDMCKKRIEKAAFGVPGVKSATWDVSSEQLNLIINEEKANVQDVQKAVAKVGHDTEGEKASEEAYSKLHTCCAYERSE